MSFIKRLGNLGKGMWKVQTAGSDPGQAERIAALQEELARKQSQAGDSAASLLVGERKATPSTPPDSEAGMQRQLDALAESLRRGDIDRATYDLRTENIIARMSGEDAPDAPAPPPPPRVEPGPAAGPPADEPPEERPFADEGGVKRTL